MKKQSLILIISLQIAILPVLGILLYIFGHILYEKFNIGYYFGNIAGPTWIVISIFSFALAIFCSIKMKKWHLRIAYIILNIFLFVFISSQLTVLLIG